VSVDDSRLALFLMLGQSAEKLVSSRVDLVPAESLPVSATFDLAEVVPDTVHASIKAAEAFKLFFVFESYLRDLIISVLSSEPSLPWWDKLPPDVKTEVETLAATEDTKSWMALGTRDKSALMTYPQLLRVVDSCWKSGFSDLVRDKAISEMRWHT